MSKTIFFLQELQMHEQDIGFFAPEYQKILGKMNKSFIHSYKNVPCL